MFKMLEQQLQICYTKSMDKLKIKRIPWNKGLKGVQVAWNKGLPRTWKSGGDFVKGHEPWNKNTKGIMKPNKTSFKKGQTAHNKGLLLSEECPAVHYWIKQKLGQPRYCENCKKTNKIQYDWANKDHLYKKIIKDWMRLCRGCHMKYDYKFNSRNKSNGYKI